MLGLTNLGAHRRDQAGGRNGRLVQAKDCHQQEPLSVNEGSMMPEVLDSPGKSIPGIWNFT